MPSPWRVSVMSLRGVLFEEKCTQVMDKFSLGLDGSPLEVATLVGEGKGFLPTYFREDSIRHDLKEGGAGSWPAHH